MTGLGSLQGLRAPAVRAQGASPVSSLLLLNTSTTRVDGAEFCEQQLHVGRHAIRYDYHHGAGNPIEVPANIVATYRDRLCDVTLELERILRPAPFTRPEDVPPDFPPAPPQFSSWRILVYRLLEPLDAETVRVYEWHSYVCAPGNVITIQADGPRHHLQYNPQEDPDGPPVVVNVTDTNPQVDFFTFQRPSPPSVTVGPGFFVAANRDQGESAWVKWTERLAVRGQQDLAVLVHIPGTSQPQQRTAQAQYQVFHANGIARITVNQQLAQSQWINLGTFGFRPGDATVLLTDVTGETTGTRTLAADAARWVNA
jgi:hypothetical protein